MTTTAADLIARARDTIDNLSVAESAEEIARGDVLLVDLREPAERQSDGYIAGSILAPRGLLEFWADPTSSHHLPAFDPCRRTIVYCASGARSALAGATLRQLGYRHVAHIDGGIKAWKDAGRPVTQDD